MRKDQIDLLISRGVFPEISHQKNLVETHISWVILCDDFVYKIKKPIRYSFLDFSTITLRKYFCEREMELNQRLSQNIYLAVLPVSFCNEEYFLGQEKGRVIDYAVKMRKLDPTKQMDILLANDKVRQKDIENLAKCISTFHKRTKVIYSKNVLNLKNEFNELEKQKKFLIKNINKEVGDLIDRALENSNKFLEINTELLEKRLASGFFRDCHGDLHTRNIFLLPQPQPFDCIEFNDDFRQIDVLNEVAFLCMDLDAANRRDFSNLFIKKYNTQFPSIRNDSERRLFNYYKNYRANVRAKVNSLRASGSPDKFYSANALKETEKYLKLMDSYQPEFTAI